MKSKMLAFSILKKAHTEKFSQREIFSSFLVSLLTTGRVMGMSNIQWMHEMNALTKAYNSSVPEELIELFQRFNEEDVHI